MLVYGGCRRKGCSERATVHVFNVAACCGVLPRARAISRMPSFGDGLGVPRRWRVESTSGRLDHVAGRAHRVRSKIPCPLAYPFVWHGAQRCAPRRFRSGSATTAAGRTSTMPSLLCTWRVCKLRVECRPHCGFVHLRA